MMRSRVRLTALLAVVVVGAGPLALPSSATACPGVKSNGRWSSIDLPPVPPAGLGGGTSYPVSSYAVTGGRPQLLYAAGGRQVFRSRDGGCSWQVAVSLDAAGSATAASRLDPRYVFDSVIVPNTLPGRSSSTVYAVAVVSETVTWSTVSLPVVLAVSRDDGATWRLSEPARADLAGDYPRCWDANLIAGADPQAVYLSCSGSGFVESVLALVRCWGSFYVSRDDGRSWTPIEPGLAAPCPSRRWSSVGTEPSTAADPRSPGWLWGVQLVVSDGQFAKGLMLSTDDGRTVKDLFGKAVGDQPQVVVSAQPDPGPRRIALYLTGAVYLSTDGGVTATKLPPVPGPADSRGWYVAAFFDPDGSALYALTAPPTGRTGPLLAPYRYDLRSGSWTVLPPWPASKEKPALWQFRSDSASPLGLYALASPTSTTPARLVVFR